MAKTGFGYYSRCLFSTRLQIAKFMSQMFVETIGPLLAAVLYLAATAALLSATRTDSASGRNAALGITGVAALLHAVLQYQAWMHQPLAQIDVATVLSLCSLVVVALWTSTLPRPSGVLESGLIALPIAALSNVVDVLFPGSAIDQGSALASAAPGTLVHVISSVIAFGLLSLAGVYAVLVVVIDHSLKRHELGRLVQSLPPLDKLEELLFRLIATGFVVLTVALASGLIYVDDLMAQHLVHKTVLSFLAWVVFGALLLGRRLKGWRGILAVRLTLAGIALLLLSYFGSKLVLEVLLGRSWYA